MSHEDPNFERPERWPTRVEAGERAPEQPPAPAPLLRPEARPRAGLGAILREGIAIAALGIVVAIAVVAVVDGAGGGAVEEPRRWTFLEEVSDPAALGFRLGVERAGAWVVDDHAEATGARALVNHAGAPGERPATAVVERLASRDVQALTRCKASSDHPEQACGVVFRYRNERNYYVARADAAASAVILAAVVDGVERPLERAAVEVQPSVWQELVVHARGERLSVDWNGRRVIEARDLGLLSPGAVGLWAPAECVAYFDELAVRALPSSLGDLDLLPFVLR